jgi:hypothetical protein
MYNCRYQYYSAVHVRGVHMAVLVCQAHYQTLNHVADHLTEKLARFALGSGSPVLNRWAKPEGYREPLLTYCYLSSKTNDGHMHSPQL